MADSDSEKFSSGYMIAAVSLLACIALQALVYLLRSRKESSGAAAEQEQTQHKSESTAGDDTASRHKQQKQTKYEELEGDRHSTSPAAAARATKKVKRGKTDYRHPWLLHNLKGHTGTVLDMDYSGNGKYLATCADAPEGAEEAENKQRLSRRQRKNRTRREEGSPGGGTMSATRAGAGAEPPPPPTLPEAQLERLLRRYVLRPDQLLSLGYPVESAFGPTRAVIYRCAPPAPRASFDVNAPEFVPAAGREDTGDADGDGDADDDAADSGRGSADSGESSPRSDSDAETQPPPQAPPSTDAVIRRCARCGVVFMMSGGDEYATRERCLYHWGRAGARDGHPPSYECCGARVGSRGCSDAPQHVWSGTTPGLNGPYEGYARTRARHGGVYALDAEMVYAASGMQLARVAVVGADGRRVYEATVKPEAPVVDYNTRFSGVRARDLERATKTLRDVQNDLMGFVGSDTILVGHGLENDLRALRLLHGRVVDTAAVFPHWRGLPWRRSLRSLAAFYLGREVQAAAHSPLQDSLACLHLMLWRVNADVMAARALARPLPRALDRALDRARRASHGHPHTHMHAHAHAPHNMPFVNAPSARDVGPVHS